MAWLWLGTWYAASRCIPMTSRKASRLRGYSENGPTSAAIFEDCRYASPVMSEVTEAA